MTIFDILTLVGGLAMFLYGMNVMGDGLTKASGGKLESILERLTKTPIMGVLLGAAVTGIIQSSSATTVMVVGFVNSGIMKLSQTVGIIMGANIGTTVTSWLLSLTAIEGDNFFLQLCKPSSFTPVLGVIGIIFIMFSKNQRKHDLAQVFLGFAVLMAGMETMSASVEPLKSDAGFTSILTMFSNPVLGVLAGFVLTAVIQSSSASVGILQALCVTDAITFSAALPIIMGQNIGTCVTAMLSSIGTSKNARRAALIHLYFNLIGTIVFLVGFYTLDAFIDFAFMDQVANASGIATLHTFFNVFATVLWLPFNKLLVKLAMISIRDTEEIEVVNEFKALDDRFLATPSFAIDQAMQLTHKMCEICKEALFMALDLIDGEYDEAVEQQIEALETKVDIYEDKLGTYLVKLTHYELSEIDSQKISILLHSIGDLERMSDHSVDLARSAKEMSQKNMAFTPAALEEMKVFSAALRDIITRTAQVFETEDLQLAASVEPLEQVIDDLNDRIKLNHIGRLKRGECTIEMGFILSDITTCYERIADHCSNLAVCQIEVHKGEFDTHQYLHGVKHRSEEFDQAKAKFAELYTLA